MATRLIEIFQDHAVVERIRRKLKEVREICCPHGDILRHLNGMTSIIGRKN